MFTKDSMVDPKTTAWFQFYDVDGKTLVEMKDLDLYKKDLIGLKKLNEEGKIELVSIEGDHLRFTKADISKYFIPALQ